MRNPEQPAREPPRGVEGVEIAERLDEGFLREVFGARAVPRHAGDEADDSGLVMTDDPLERGLRPRERLGDEPGFDDRLEVDRYPSALAVAYVGGAPALQGYN